MSTKIMTIILMISAFILVGFKMSIPEKDIYDYISIILVPFATILFVLSNLEKEDKTHLS